MQILKIGCRYISSWSNGCLDSKFQISMMFEESNHITKTNPCMMIHIDTAEYFSIQHSQERLERLQVLFF